MASGTGVAERKRPEAPVSRTRSTAVHLILQGKGGVGKSLVASILAQYLMRRGDRLVHCVDTDPVNQTFAQYQELGVKRLNLLVDGGIDQRGFDGLMERLLTEDGVFVVDNGASTFVPMWNYILENDVIRVLRDTGHVFIRALRCDGRPRSVGHTLRIQVVGADDT